MDQPESKRTVLPDMNKSAMLQGEGWRAAKRKMSIEEFREDQKSRQKKANSRSLLKKCPSNHQHELRGHRKGYQIMWCTDCQDFRAVKVG